MMIKNILSITLAFSLASSLYGAEEKPKKQTKTSVKNSKEQVKNTSLKIDENEFEISKSEVMPKVTLPVIRDNKTQTVYDPTTKLMWQDNSEVKNNAKNWQDAMSYCDNLTLGGYSDWRLPDIKELLSITDVTRYDPVIKSGFKNVRTDGYWSGSIYAKDSDDAWYVHFDRGYEEPYTKGYNFLVRCVRDSN